MLNEIFIINSKTTYFRTYDYMKDFLCSDVQNSQSVQAFWIHLVCTQYSFGVCGRTPITYLTISPGT